MQPASQSHSTHGCRPAGRTTLGSALAALVFLGASLAQGVAEAQIPPTVSAPPRLTLFGPLPGNPSPPDEDAKDTTVFLCAPEEICIPLHGEDDEGDHISLSLILPTGFVPLASSDSSLDTTHCFTPDTAGVYCFVFELDDDDTGNGMIESDDDVDSVCVTVVFNDPPTITCPPNVTLQCGSSTDPLSTGFATAEITCSQPASCACNGGIRLLSLQTALPYAGGVISIEARAAKNGMLDSSPYGVDTEVFDGTLFTSATFTGAVAITRMEAVGTDVVVTYTVDVGLIALTKMASNSEFRVTAPSATNEQPIHTSCSQPIAPPFDFGAFSIVGLIDKGGSECNLDSTNCICVIDSITYSDSVTPGACPQEFTIVRTWTAFDSGGNQASCDQTISVADTTSPTITCPEDVTLECNAGGNTGTASATDNCDPAPVISFSDVITVGACPGDSVITRTWNATDACGNSELCVQTITISDTTPPSITCPADVTLECGAGGATGSATATDNCDANPSVFSADSVVAGACPGDTTIFRTWTATDTCGNSATCQQKITIRDTTPPAITCPSDATVLCNQSRDPGSTGSASAVDVCDPNPDITSSDQVTGGANPGDSVILRTWVATDCSGNTGTCVQRIDLPANHAPVAICPADGSQFLCAPGQVCVVGFGATDVDGNLDTIIFDGGSLGDSTACFTADTSGVYSLTLIAIDSCGAADTCLTSVTVTINSAPIPNCPGAASFTLCGPEQICVGPFTFTDADNNVQDTSYSIGTPSGSDVCFTPDTAGVYSIVCIVTDSCGATGTCETLVTVNFIASPDIQNTSHSISLCAPGIQRFPLPTVTGGAAPFSFTVNGAPEVDSVSFDLQSDTLIVCEVIVTDSCGNADTATMTINATVNVAPIVTAQPRDTFLCDAGETVRVKLTLFDPDNGLSGTSVLGAVSMADSTATFIPGSAGTFCDTVVISDSCGLTATTTYCVVVTLNSPPVFTSCPSDTTLNLCAGETACLDPLVVNDSDGNLQMIVRRFEGPGGPHEDPVPNGHQVCVSSDTSAVFDFVFIAFDSCLAEDTCSFSVTVNIIPPPQLDSTRTFDFGFRCNTGRACLQLPPVVGGKLPLTYSVSGPCTLDTGFICVDLNGGVNEIVCTLTVTDSCGSVARQVITLKATVNLPPVAGAPDSSETALCDFNSVICVPGFSCADPDNNLDTQRVIITPAPASPPSFNGGSVCFAPGTDGVFTISFICIDECGGADTATTRISVIPENPLECRPCPTVSIDFADSSLQGEKVCLPVTTEGSPRDFAAFDLLIAYDNSALSALGAFPGAHLEACGWEYFTFRFGPNGNCGACPSGLIRVTALANVNDGAGFPDCFGPGHQNPVEIATVCFLVSNDRTLECNFAPVRFFWADCGDNTFADPSGDTLLASGDVFDFNNPVSISDPNAGFPTSQGSQAACFIGGGPGKPSPTPCVTFNNGGVKIACADSIDARGDLNLNGLSNEIADAVLYTKYFIDGIGAFIINPPGQIAASEVNGDGAPLTVADLVYMIRVITGDALPVPKLAHDRATVEFEYRSGVYSATQELGAALFVFDGDADVELLQSRLELTIGRRDGRTFALVAPALESGAVGETVRAGELIASDAALVSIEASDPQGSLVEALSKVVLPTAFALHQNYPNPFNPSTKIRFDLPESVEYTLSIFNISGQLVDVFTGTGAGEMEVEWSAGDLSSGMYFYKLHAGRFTSTRKALLLK